MKWKLLATPQLGGASSYFSNITHPGIHVKAWRGSPKNEKVVSHNNSINNSSRTIIEEELGTSVDCTPSSSSTVAAAAVVTGYSLASSGKHNDHSSRPGIYSRLKTTTSTTNTTSNSSVNSITGMNDISALLLDTNNNNNVTSDTLPHPTRVGNNNVTGRLNPALKMGWLPGMRQPMATSDIGLASLIDDKVD